jgi:hypothetical protein
MIEWFSTALLFIWGTFKNENPPYETYSTANGTDPAANAAGDFLAPAPVGCTRHRVFYVYDIAPLRPP